MVIAILTKMSGQNFIERGSFQLQSVAYFSASLPFSFSTLLGSSSSRIDKSPLLHLTFSTIEREQQIANVELKLGKCGVEFVMRIASIIR